MLSNFNFIHCNNDVSSHYNFNLLTEDIEHFFMCLVAIVMNSFMKYLLNSSAHFYCTVFILLWICSNFNISGYKSSVKYISVLMPTICGLPFTVLIAKFLNDGDQYISFFLLCLVFLCVSSLRNVYLPKFEKIFSYIFL